MRELMRLVDRVMVISFGSRLAEGAPAEIVHDPQVIEAYLGARGRSLQLLTVDSLSAAYGALRVLHDVSLAIDEGELVSLIGPNGAGKTTLLRAISRLVATEGSIRFDGRELTGLSPQEVVAQGVIQCAEGRKLFTDMTAGDNLELGAYLRSDQAGIRADLERVYALFPCSRAAADSAPARCRGASSRCSPSARADEQAQDPAARRTLVRDLADLVERIFAVIRQLNEEGLTALVVEQNAGMALEVSVRTYVLESGRIVLSGPSREVAANRAVRESYLGM